MEKLYKFSEETRKKMSESKKGKKRKPFSTECKSKMSLSAKKRKPPTKETRIKMSKFQKGKKVSNETRVKMSIAKKGEKSRFWMGGINPINDTIRKSLEYKNWRKECLLRDNFRCQKTGISGGYLEVHHINNFSDFPELRFVINNGITLSKISHKEFHKIYGFKNNTREQLIEFLNN